MGHLLIIVKYGDKAPFPLHERPLLGVFCIVIFSILYGWILIKYDDYFHIFKNILIKNIQKSQIYIYNIENLIFKSVLIIGSIVVISSFILERDFFEFDNLINSKKWIIYITIKLLFIFLVYFLLFMGIKTIKNTLGNKRLWTIFFIMAGVYIGASILTWPGNWNNDEFLILNSIKNFDFVIHQSIFTNLYFILCMMLIPDAGIIILIQSIICSIISSYIIYTIYKKVGKYAAILVMLVFISPPVIYYVLYPLRVGLYSFVFLFTIIYILENIHIKEYNNIKILKMAMLISIVSLWRKESLFLIILLPLLLLIYLKLDRKKVIIFSSYILIFSILTISIENQLGDKKVEQTATLWSFETGLSVLLNQENLNSDNLERDLNNIDAIMPIDKLKMSNTSWDFELVSNNVGALEFTNQEYNKFLFSAGNLIIRNPVKYIKAKWQLFANSTALNREYAWVPPALDEENTYKVFDIYGIPQELYRYCRPLWNNNIRLGIIYALTGMYTINDGKIPVYYFVWNEFIPIIILILAILISLFRKKIIDSIISFSIIIDFVLCYLMAPTVAVMYFFPFYIMGYIVSIYLLGIKREKN